MTLDVRDNYARYLLTFQRTLKSELDVVRQVSEITRIIGRDFTHVRDEQVSADLKDCIYDSAIRWFTEEPRVNGIKREQQRLLVIFLRNHGASLIQVCLEFMAQEHREPSRPEEKPPVWKTILLTCYLYLRSWWRRFTV